MLGSLRRLLGSDDTCTIDFARWEIARLREQWVNARPFGHIVVDNLVSNTDLKALRRAVAEEPHERKPCEISDNYGSAFQVKHPTLQSFQAALGSAQGRAAVAAITGKREAGKVVMRSFIYPDGGYLLPHNDYREELGRLVAFAYYVDTSGEGGELELFDCTMDGDDVVETRTGTLIPAIANRLVLFDVSAASLHAVREIVGGRRSSFSGWFYA